MHPENIKKILIFRLSSIGDIVLTFPLIRALRTHYPDAIIDFVVKKQYAELVSANPYLNHIWAFDTKAGLPGLMALKYAIRCTGYDLLLDVHRSLRSWYLRKLLFHPKILKYRKHLLKRWLLIVFKVNLFKNPVSIIQRYLDTVNGLGIDNEKRDLEIFIPPRTHKRIREVLRRHIQAGSTMLIGFCPGAGFPTKRWPVQEFCKVGNYFMTRGNTQIVILGGAEDAALGEQIRMNVCGPVFNACGLFSLLESTAVIARCNAVLTNDTGMLHTATALKKPTVALFGPTTREMGYFPESEKVVVLEKNIPCRPCTHNGSHHCPEGHFSCMNKISSEEVCAALENLIGKERFNSLFVM